MVDPRLLTMLARREPQPSARAIAGAAAALTLGQLAPPVLYRSSTRELLHGRALAEAADGMGCALVAAVDLDAVDAAYAAQLEETWTRFGPVLGDPAAATQLAAALARALEADALAVLESLRRSSSGS